MVPFGGWVMPLAYSEGTIAEHLACRGDSGPGRAQYTHLLEASDASVTDDIIVWWLDETRFDVMPNASNTARVLDALGGDDITASRAVIAIQGPQARARLAPVVPEAAAVGRF